MYISDNLIFLQLQKTACTHIQSILRSYFPGEQVGKHGPLTFDAGDRRIIGSIRNPFDWYVSLWSYGCLERGNVCATLTSGRVGLARRILRERARHPSLWKEVPAILAHISHHNKTEFDAFYSDPNDPALFRAWLKRILEGSARPYIEGDYPLKPVDTHLGLLTYRFLRLFTDFQAWTERRHALRNQSDVRQFYQDNANCSTFIRNERLEGDLAAVLRDMGIETTAAELRRDKVNASKHRPYTDYYDDASAALVRDRDRLICDLFSYELNGRETR